MRRRLALSLGLGLAFVAGSLTQDAAACEDAPDCWVWEGTVWQATFADGCDCTDPPPIPTTTTGPLQTFGSEVDPTRHMGTKIFSATSISTPEFAALSHPCVELYKEIAGAALKAQALLPPDQRAGSRVQPILVAEATPASKCQVYVHGMNESDYQPMVYATEMGASALIGSPAKPAIPRDGINIYTSWHSYTWDHGNSNKLDLIDDARNSTLLDGANGRICDGLPGAGCRSVLFFKGWGFSTPGETVPTLLLAYARALRRHRDTIRIFFHSRGTIFGYSYGLFSWSDPTAGSESFDAWYLGGACPMNPATHEPTDHCLWGQADPVPGVIYDASIAASSYLGPIGWTHFPGWMPVQDGGDPLAVSRGKMRLLPTTDYDGVHNDPTRYWHLGADGYLHPNVSAWGDVPWPLYAPTSIPYSPLDHAYYGEPGIAYRLDLLLSVAIAGCISSFEVCLGLVAAGGAAGGAFAGGFSVDPQLQAAAAMGRKWHSGCYGRADCFTHFYDLPYWDTDGNGVGHESTRYLCAASTRYHGMPTGLAITGEGDCQLGTTTDLPTYNAARKLPDPPGITP